MINTVLGALLYVTFLQLPADQAVRLGVLLAQMALLPLFLFLFPGSGRSRLRLF